jgi:hypothetical protein
MTSSIDKVRALTATNAALSDHAARAQQNILDSAEKECARLTALIQATKPADVLCDDDKATDYQSWVTQRAALIRLLEERAR